MNIINIVKALTFFLLLWSFCAVNTAYAKDSSSHPNPNLSIQLGGVPAVFLTPIRVIDIKSPDGESITIQPPFFRFSLSFKNTNPSGQTLVITGVRVEVFTSQNEGLTPDLISEFVPSDCLYEDDAKKGLINPCGLPASSAYASIRPDDSIYTLPYTFYVENLPEQEDGSFSYPISVEIFGFWSDETDPKKATGILTDRLEETKIEFHTL